MSSEQINGQQTQAWEAFDKWLDTLTTKELKQLLEHLDSILAGENPLKPSR